MAKIITPVTTYIADNMKEARVIARQLREQGVPAKAVHR